MFANQLKKYRIEAKLTLEQFANSINKILGTNYTKNTIRSWENGINPKIEAIEAIAKILNIPVQYLFDDSDEAIKKIIDLKYPGLFQINFYKNELIKHLKKLLHEIEDK